MEENRKMVDRALEVLLGQPGLGERIFSRLEAWEAGGLTFKDFEQELAGVAQLCSKLIVALKTQELYDARAVTLAREQELKELQASLLGEPGA